MLNPYDTKNGGAKAAEDRRKRQATHEAQMWDAALAAAVAAAKAPPAPAASADLHQENLGAMGSLAHRADKTTVRPPDASRDESLSTTE